MIKESELKTDRLPDTKIETLNPIKDRSIKESELKMANGIGRYKNRNFKSTDFIGRYNRKIKSVSEDR